MQTNLIGCKSRVLFAAAGLTVAGTVPANDVPAAVPAPYHRQFHDTYSAHHDFVLGTSLGLILPATSPDQARLCEACLLAEVQRLSDILSTYDTCSEISRMMSGADVESDELAEIFALYDLWGSRTGGAIDINLAAVKQLWIDSQSTGAIPESRQSQHAYRSPRSFNIDALGKAYIVDRAAKLLKSMTPAGLLNIGGDIRAWGDHDFTIAVADPYNQAENAVPAAMFTLRNQAAATSGGYARGVIVAGKQYSHLIDPRTLKALSDVHQSSTVTAPDCVTANAVSTAICILGLPNAQSIANEFAVGHFTIHAGQSSNGGELLDFVEFPAPQSRAAGDAPAKDPPATRPAAGAWPKDFQVEIGINLKSPAGRAKRPYVAVWIEDEKGKPIRNVSVWGDRDKYLPDLSTWWKVIKGDQKVAHAVTAATRPPGKYSVVWDGKDDAGVAVPRGNYHIRVEINREHGRHADSTTTIVCGDKPATAAMRESVESDESVVRFAKPQKK